MHILTIGLVSISSIIPQEQFEIGTNILAQAGYSLKVAPNVIGPGVASAEERARLLETFWLDPEIDMLLFSRGGEGGAEVLPLIDWNAIAVRPDLPVMGFSDVTLLLNAMLAKGIGHPISGPMLSYADRLTPEARDWLRTVLDDAPLPPVHVSVLSSRENCPSVSGLPMGGHVERLHRLMNMKLLPSAQNRVVFLECTARYAPERVKCFLEELRENGAFEGALAVVFCDFRHKGQDYNEINAIIKNFATTLSCPVFGNFPYGHIPNIHALDFRRKITLSGENPENPE